MLRSQLTTRCGDCHNSVMGGKSARIRCDPGLLAGWRQGGPISQNPVSGDSAAAMEHPSDWNVTACNAMLPGFNSSHQKKGMSLSTVMPRYG